MTKRQSKKRTLLASIISMVLCVAMLVGATMAWFTDTVSVSGNEIKSGTLEVGLEYLNAAGEWEDAEGKTLSFLKAGVNAGESGEILWEPNCTYALPQIRITNKNKDNKGLALQYSLVVRGAVGSSKLLEVIDFTIDDQELSTVKGTLLPGEMTEPITIKGHMDEKAGNEYQGLTLEGISITVYATQTPYEYDSYTNQYDAGAGDSATYIIENPDVNPEEEFDVYQKHGAYPLNATGGFAIVAEFAGAPGQIYVARTSSYIPADHDYGDGEGGAPWDTMAIARVEDPNGNLVALYDFSDVTDGRKAVIIDIPEGEAGVWTIRMMNGQPGDVFEIGIKNPEHWGVRGEKILGSGSISGSYYLYAQKTAKYAYFASDVNPSVSSDEYGLYKLDENLNDRSLISNFVKNAIGISYKDYYLQVDSITPDTVYELRLPEDFEGTMLIDGIPGLLCPTAEDALALKGNWVEEDGILYQGVLQARAREELVKLASNHDLTVKIDKPAEIPWEKVENPIAEAQLFGIYGAVSGLSGTLNRQVIDPNSPYCGAVFILAHWDAQNKGPIASEDYLRFQWGSYQYTSVRDSLRQGVRALAAAATTDLELNYFYENEALIKRTVLELLYMISVGLDESAQLRQNDFRTATYPSNDSVFTLGAMFEAYAKIEPYLDCVDESAQEVLREGLLLLCDKMGDYRGQGVTNQAAFGMQARLMMYLVTGDDRYHEAFKRQYTAILDGTWSMVGYNEAGYFVEDAGLDGSYEYMNREAYYGMYNVYKHMENADPVLVQKMREMIEESLEFESLFTVPQPDESAKFAIYTGHFNSRTSSYFMGRYSDPSYETVIHEFPMAARRWQVAPEYASDAKYYPRVINTEAWAKQYIETYWDEYENYWEKNTPTSQRFGSHQIWTTYEAFQSGPTEPCKLPCEEDEGYLRENNDGIVALKHKDLYVMSFYNTNVDSNYTSVNAYMGGGPTIISSEGTGSVVSSMRHTATGSNLKNDTQVVSSCIYGTNADGTFFVSGKERADLTWLEQNKSFVISGDVSEKSVSWQYDLTDAGVDITAGLAGSGVTGEYWINLQICAVDKGSASAIELAGNTLTFKFGEEIMEFSWEENLEAKTETIKANNTNYECLRIKLPQETMKAKISVCLK